MADREHLPDNPRFDSAKLKWQDLGLWFPIWQTTNSRSSSLVEEVDEDFLALPRWHSVEFDPILEHYPARVKEARSILGEFCDIPKPIIQVRYFCPPLFQNEELHIDLFDQELRLDTEQIREIGRWATEIEPLEYTIG